jgi:hypothetical protein
MTECNFKEPSMSNQVIRIGVRAIITAGLLSSTVLTTPASAASLFYFKGPTIAQDADGAACYKHKFSGLYQTFKPGDVQFKPEWVFIHNGNCECEGKTGDQCQEPGDQT